MTWVKLDDNATNHTKVLAAGVTAFAIWNAGLGYCNREHTDGFIPAHMVPTLFQSDDITKVGRRRAVERLVRVGLWESVEGGFQVHDYAEYQEKALSEHHKAACAKEAARKRAARTSEKLHRKSEETSQELRKNSKSEPSDYPGLGAVSDPSRSRPVPVPEEPSVPSLGESACARPTGKFPSSTLVAQVYEMFRAEAHKRGLRPAPTLTHNQRGAAAERVLELADGGDLEAAARSCLQAAFDDSASTGKSVVLTLTDCQPGRPAALRAVRGGRVAPAPAAPHSAFDNQPDDAEIVLGKLLAKQAAKEAAKLAEKEARTA